MLSIPLILNKLLYIFYQVSKENRRDIKVNTEDNHVRYTQLCLEKVETPVLRDNLGEFLKEFK